MTRAHTRAARGAKNRQPARMNRPRNATEKAIACVIFRWHVQGLQQQLRRGG